MAPGEPVSLYLVVPLGFVTGAFGAPVAFGWLLRRHGCPEAQGRRALAYLLASTGVTIGMAVWLIVWPWL